MKSLVVYFSWSGNVRAVAEEIQKQTGAVVFEITPETQYTDDYNALLDIARAEQRNKARPAFVGSIENLDEYSVVYLGFPNWWADMPMIVYTLLDEYDLSGKTIIPFCSHGGGRFGQSLTAIAKLAPDINMGAALSIHYSGGSSLIRDIGGWLYQNGIQKQ